jgi:hypothetical protein
MMIGAAVVSRKADARLLGRWRFRGNSGRRRLRDGLLADVEHGQVEARPEVGTRALIRDVEAPADRTVVVIRRARRRLVGGQGEIDRDRGPRRADHAARFRHALLELPKQALARLVLGAATLLRDAGELEPKLAIDGHLGRDPDRALQTTAERHGQARKREGGFLEPPVPHPGTRRPGRQAHADEREEQRDQRAVVTLAELARHDEKHGARDEVPEHGETDRDVRARAIRRAQARALPRLAPAPRLVRVARAELFLDGELLAPEARADHEAEAHAAEHEAETELEEKHRPAQVAVDDRLARLVRIDVGRDGRAARLCRAQLVVDALLEIADVVGATRDRDARADVAAVVEAVFVRGRGAIGRRVVALVALEVGREHLGLDRHPLADVLPFEQREAGPEQGAEPDGRERQREEHEAAAAPARAEPAIRVQRELHDAAIYAGRGLARLGQGSQSRASGCAARRPASIMAARRGFLAARLRETGR